MSFDWKPSLGSIDITNPVRWFVIADKARETFWSATYDDLPEDGAFHRNAFTIGSGQSVMAWVEIEGGHAKGLFEWAPSFEGSGILCTWIAYRDRVRRSLKLVNHIKATPVGGAQSDLLEKTLWKYDGPISLATKKFFLSDETRALGDEQWFWDDQLVTDQGIALPGGSVILDAFNRQLIVHVDQSGLTGGEEPIAATHRVRFKGKDVFENSLETKLVVYTFPKTLVPRPIALNPPLGPGFVFPLHDPLRDRPVVDPVALAALSDLLAPRVGPTEAASIGRPVSDALSTGEGVLDQAGASGLVALITGGHAH